MTLPYKIYKVSGTAAAVLLLAATTACSGGGGDANRAGMSELDSLLALQESAKKDTPSNPYGSSLSSGTYGRPMHRIVDTETKAVYCYAGETLMIKSSAKGRCRISLYNATENKHLGSREVNPQIDWSIPIAVDGIYAMQITSVDNDKEAPSASYTLSFPDSDSTDRPEVAVNVVSASKSDLMSYATTGIRTVDVFKEPKRIALRANVKAAFSGHSRAIVTVPVPSGADLLVYSLRVSNNENSVAADGKFSNRLASNYNKVKLLGIPVYESNSGYNLGSLLFDARPPSEDDAFCSMFVFDSAAGARKFQSTSGKSENLYYNVDLSQIGTQSCTGELPCSGRSNIYLGFENERMRYDTFIWLEVTAIIQKTDYLKPEFSSKQ